VLHHLESPEAGLAALAAVLDDDGAMGIMLYARYGREGVYQIQSLLKILNQNEPNMQRKVDNCKSVLRNLAPTNTFKDVAHLFSDISYGDAGIYDLFLHSNDVAYSVPDIYAFLDSSNLKLSHFLFGPNVGLGNNLYRLESYITDGSLSSVIANMSVPQKQAAAELMHGKIIMHGFYAKKILSPVPSPDDVQQIPFFPMVIHNGYEAIYNLVKQVRVGQEVRVKAFDRREVGFVKSENAELIFKAMDGNKTIGDICKEVKASYAQHRKQPNFEEIKKEFKAIFAAFNSKDLMYLRDKTAPGVRTLQELAGRGRSSNEAT
jgi:hypothetical protein